jgi:UDP-3-O-[3-hydroxymyristoyl] glucosamine N-acyltransferase
MKQHPVSIDGAIVAMTLAELAKEIGAEITGDGAAPISAAATLEEAGPTQISFLSNPRYEKLLQTTRAGAVIVAANVVCDRLNLLKTSDPYLAFARAVIALHGHRVHPHGGVHPRALVDETAIVGEGSVVYPGAFVGPRARIGRDCILYPNAVIYDDCVLGDRVIIHAGACIGSDGYGYATSKGVHHKIPQAGNVVIEDDVEIGANAVIARATLGSTVIGRGTKIDSLVSIAHGVKIGEYGLIVSLVGIAGSTTIGHHAILGGQVGIAGHLEIGNYVTAAGQSGITNDVPDKSVLQGSPAMPISQSRRVHVIFRNLPELVDRVRKLEHDLAEPSKTQENENRQ